MYDDQLNLTRSSIKNILFEITKEFKKMQNSNKFTVYKK